MDVEREDRRLEILRQRLGAIIPLHEVRWIENRDVAARGERQNQQSIVHLFHRFFSGANFILRSEAKPARALVMDASLALAIPAAARKSPMAAPLSRWKSGRTACRHYVDFGYDGNDKMRRVWQQRDSALNLRRGGAQGNGSQKVAIAWLDARARRCLGPTRRVNHNRVKWAETTLPLEMATPSALSRRCFLFRPVAKPVSLPSAPTTRWQGTFGA